MQEQVGPLYGVSAEAGPVAGMCVVRLVGEVDSEACRSLGQVLLDEVGRATVGVVLELSGVTFFGSAGITLVVDAWQAARRTGVGFAVAAGHSTVLTPLRVTEVDQFVVVCADLEQAVTTALRAVTALSSEPDA